MKDIRSSITRGWMAFAASGARVAALDFALLAFAVCLGYMLRLSIMIAPSFQAGLAASSLSFAACVVAGLAVVGSYRVHWPQAGVDEYARLARGYVIGAAVFLCVSFFSGAFLIPRSSLAVALLSGLIFISSVRASWRLCELSGERRKASADVSKRALIIGAGEAGAYIARDLARRPGGLVPLGFIDDDPHKRNKMIAGLSVLGGSASLPEISRELGAQVALIAIPSAGGKSIRKYLDALKESGVEVRVLPSLRELAGGAVEVSSMRRIELQDLLRRDAIQLDEQGIGAALTGKRVMVTGAGGSIGSELCTQIARHAPAELIMLGRGEGSIYDIVQRFSEAGESVSTRRVIADIADDRTMRRVISSLRPQVIFHAAAHKHVPLMEENPREALRVNSHGTMSIAEIAGELGAEKFVMISTDKAVHPSSVMGATKRIAERLLRCVQQRYPATAYMTVRFGNVLGSRGSVVPLFERQIARGGPVTVTHPDMTRYFMLIPEAVSLVLQAASMGSGGELFVLDMGEPVKITEMAETLIRLHGRTPGKDVKIVFTGIREGEKLYEELFYDPDHVDRTAHDKIFLSRLDDETGTIEERVEELLASDASDDEIKNSIFKLAER